MLDLATVSVNVLPGYCWHIQSRYLEESFIKGQQSSVMGHFASPKAEGRRRESSHRERDGERWREMERDGERWRWQEEREREREKEHKKCVEEGCSQPSFFPLSSLFLISWHCFPLLEPNYAARGPGGLLGQSQRSSPGAQRKVEEEGSVGQTEVKQVKCFSEIKKNKVVSVFWEVMTTKHDFYLFIYLFIFLFNLFFNIFIGV